MKNGSLLVVVHLVCRQVVVQFVLWYTSEREGFERACGAVFGAIISVPRLNMVSATPSKSVSVTFS